MKYTVAFSLVVLSLGFSSCKDEKEKGCEVAYERIKKCMPKRAGNKKQQIRVCRETYKRSSTEGTVVCARNFDSCDKFKACLNYSAKCGDYDGKQFTACLNAAHECDNYRGSAFRHCVTCVSEKGMKGDTIASCVKEAETASKASDPKKTTKSTTPTVPKGEPSTTMSPTAKPAPATPSPSSPAPATPAPAMK